jgi:hypothetical protein
MTITFAMWWIPTIITAIALFWAMFIVDDGGGYMSGLSNIFALIPALFISCVSWIVYAIFK